MTYDDDYMREHLNELRREDAAALRSFNACHRGLLTDDECDDLAAFVAAKRPELIRYRTRLETDTWPVMTSTTTPTRLRVSTRPSVVPALTTRRARFSGSSSCRRSTSASASSDGRSARRSGSGWADAVMVLLVAGIAVAWAWAARLIGGA